MSALEPIYALHDFHSGWSVFVGQRGVTEIVPYEIVGVFRVMRGDKVWLQVPEAHVVVEYETSTYNESAEETDAR